MHLRGMRQRTTAVLRRGTKPAFVLAAAAALTLAVSATAGGASNGRTVKTEGDEKFVPNAKVEVTLKFAPGHITIKSGETLTLVHSDKTEDPHTLSIVSKDQVPGSVADVFNCGSPGTVCDQVFQVFTGQPDGSIFVNDPGTAEGLDAPYDSLFVLPGESVSAPVTAPSGSTLYFICAIHAWMQGEIDVQ